MPAAFERATLSGNVSPAAWVVERLRPPATGTVGSLVPQGFEAYARVLHPARRLDGEAVVPVRWSEVAAWSGRTLHPRTQFERLARPASGSGVGPAPWDGEPPEAGHLPPDQAAALAGLLRRSTATPDACWFCLWDGYGFLHPGATAVYRAGPPPRFLLARLLRRRGPVRRRAAASRAGCPSTPPVCRGCGCRGDTAVAIDGGEDELAKVKVRATRRRVEQLLAWAERFGQRTWAVESAGGLGYLLGQQLVAAGPDVVDVPATLASRVRVLASGRSNENDPNDAPSVAVAALRAPALRPVRTADHAEVLRLLAKGNLDFANHRTRVVCRLHATLAALAPGGIAKELHASDADQLLARVRPVTPVEQARHELALERLDDVRRLDAQLKESHRRIRQAVRTSLTELFGVGPLVACVLIGYAGDVRRFRTRDRFAAYDGTAPIELSSGGRVVHRLSQRGNRRLNHALHLAALRQIRQPHSEGRACFDRKVAEGKTKKEAPRALERQVSNAVYRQLLVDAERAGT